MSYLQFNRLRVRSGGIGLLAVCVAVFIAGCSSAPRTSVPPASATGIDLRDSADPTLSRLTPRQATDVTFYAMNLVGTPYRYGGNTPDSGFDCSGLIGYVYKLTGGISLPRSVSGLQFVGAPVPAERVRAGDLVVFGREGESTHAGIYVGEGRFVHAPSTGGEVRLDSLKSKYWSTQRTSFRRP